MKTNPQLLEEYTALINDAWQKMERKARIKTAIETSSASRCRDRS